MSMTKSLIVCAFLPRKINYYNSQTYILSVNKIPGLFWDTTKRSVHQNISTGKRRFGVCNFVEPGAPLPPDQPDFNLLQWIAGVVAAIFPFFINKWAPLLKIKDNVDTAVEAAEGIVDAVENVADTVENMAEDIAENLPEGGKLRRAVDFVENVAERISDDAELVGDFIDKFQEMGDRVEDYVESLAVNNEDDKVHGHANDEPQSVNK